MKIVLMCFMSLATASAYAAPIEFTAGGVLDLNGASGLDTATSFTLSNVSGTSLNVFGVTGTGILSADLPPAFTEVTGFLNINGLSLNLSSINDATITAAFVEGAGSLFDGDHAHAATWSISAENPTNSSLTVNAVVPVPAAVWLFGSGLIGLVGLARRKA
ncbi:MAG: VPLPA-CTERM sorting domain-containing protein [Gammaproteobacteria bacterium]